MVRQSLFQEFMPPPIPDRAGVAEVRARYGSKVLAIPKGAAADFDYTLNPYVGCGFACEYCFAANFVADEERKRSWGRWVEVKAEAEEQVARADLRGKSIFMSSATDPYQPIERKLELTRRIVEILSQKQAHLVVQTRSPIAARDIDIFRSIRNIRVNMSITTDSEEIRMRFEPSCASIEQRLQTLKKIGDAGIPTTVCIAPMPPILDPKRFAERILEIRPDRVVTSFFHFKDTPFSASTRDPALKIIEEYGWTKRDFEKTKEQLHKFLPMLKSWRD